MAANKLGNQYQDLFPEYEETPKSVIAAVALSLATRITGEDNLEQAKKIIREEWDALHNSGIVPQKPRKIKPVFSGALRDSAVRRLHQYCVSRGIPFVDKKDGTVEISGTTFGNQREAETFLSKHE